MNRKIKIHCNAENVDARDKPTLCAYMICVCLQRVKIVHSGVACVRPAKCIIFFFFAFYQLFCIFFVERIIYLRCFCSLEVSMKK